MIIMRLSTRKIERQTVSVLEGRERTEQGYPFLVREGVWTIDEMINSLRYPLALPLRDTYEA